MNELEQLAVAVRLAVADLVEGGKPDLARLHDNARRVVVGVGELVKLYEEQQSRTNHLRLAILHAKSILNMVK